MHSHWLSCVPPVSSALQHTTDEQQASETQTCHHGRHSLHRATQHRTQISSVTAVSVHCHDVIHLSTDTSIPSTELG